MSANLFSRIRGIDLELVKRTLDAASQQHKVNGDTSISKEISADDQILWPQTP